MEFPEFQTIRALRATVERNGCRQGRAQCRQSLQGRRGTLGRGDEEVIHTPTARTGRAVCGFRGSSAGGAHAATRSTDLLHSEVTIRPYANDGGGHGCRGDQENETRKSCQDSFVVCAIQSITSECKGIRHAQE
jgi:hypothetical protein